MLYIPTIPLIRSVNERLSIYLLPRDVVVIDILNQKGKRVYLRVSWKILKSIRQRKVYKSLVEGAKLNIEEEGEVAMVHRWNITFGKASNYGYQVLFNSNLQSCGIGSDNSFSFMLQWGEFSNTMQAIEKLKDQSYTAGYHFGDFTPRATSMIAFFYIFVYYYHIKMRKLCMKCLIPSFPLHDVCCIHEVNSVINHEIARDAVKHLTVHKLKEMVFKMIEIYALSSEGFNDYNYEKFLSNIDIKDFNRAIRYHFDPAMTENMNVVPE